MGIALRKGVLIFIMGRLSIGGSPPLASKTGTVCGRGGIKGEFELKANEVQPKAEDPLSPRMRGSPYRSIKQVIVCGRGGIGIRARLRFVCRKA